MAVKIEERFRVGMYKARRVIRTESNYCINQADIDRMLEGTAIEEIEQELDRQITEMNALPESDSTLNPTDENSLKMLTGGENGGIINAITIDDISKEAIIHEVKHAETIYGRTYANYECINEELQYDAFKIPISGREDKKSIYNLAGDISKLAQKDGLECIAECGVKLERGENIDEDLKAFHDKYTSGGG